MKYFGHLILMIWLMAAVGVLMRSLADQIKARPRWRGFFSNTWAPIAVTVYVLLVIWATTYDAHGAMLPANYEQPITSYFKVDSYSIHIWINLLVR